MTRQWRDPAQRELWQLTIDALRDVDRVFTQVADEVYVIVAGFPVINATTRPIVMRRIDAVLNRAFGSTQRAAVTSDLFRVILRNTDRAAAAPYARMFQLMESVATQSSPTLWGRVRLRLLSGGYGPNDRLATVYAALNGPVAQQQRVLRTGLLDPARRWADPNGYTLSQRVWSGGRDVRRQLNDIIADTMLHGDSPHDLAARVERYLNPEYAPTRYLPDGRQVGRKGPRQRHGSSFARTLARTELSRIHAVATVQAVKDAPGTVGIQWLVANSHDHIDECTRRSRDNRHSLGNGVYPVDDAPVLPEHPNCRCVYAPVMKPRGHMLDELVQMYGGL